MIISNQELSLHVENQCIQDMTKTEWQIKDDDDDDDDDNDDDDEKGHLNTFLLNRE